MILILQSDDRSIDQFLQLTQCETHRAADRSRVPGIGMGEVGWTGAASA
ncbi:MAG: hypothetical protein OXE84_11590 [Rhodobacteraceae bacterium]|nr:hypothetical protein [Paracoccaceae bacterium]MCY4197489.1 hypothetical protein [Paracoccaceae bacterium]MCY4326979.1 hypothetical protein [Paracoccaceae bacterium]